MSRHRGGGCGSSSGHQRALRRLTQHVDLHIGAHGELGESGDRLLPGVRCCGGGGCGVGERGGDSQGQDPLPLLQLRSESPSPVPSAPTPRKPGEPQSRGADNGVAAGSLLYSLEAQQTNTFILRHFQCRLWVGVAGEEIGPEWLSPDLHPLPSSLRNSPFHPLQTAPLGQCPSVPPPPFAHWSWWLRRQP